METVLLVVLQENIPFTALKMEKRRGKCGLWHETKAFIAPRPVTKTGHCAQVHKNTEMIQNFVQTYQQRRGSVLRTLFDFNSALF